MRHTTTITFADRGDFSIQIHSLQKMTLWLQSVLCLGSVPRQVFLDQV